MILAGYIVGNIDGFKPAFEEIKNNSEYIDREGLVELLDTIMENERIDRIRKEDKTQKLKKVPITLKSILKIYKTDLDLTSARTEIGEYLMNTNFLVNR